MRQRRIRAWRAWLAIAGLVGHLLAMVAVAGGAHASWVVDPASGQRLAIALCTDAGLADAPLPDGPGTAHAAQAHDCVLCAVHGGGLPGMPASVRPAPVAAALWAPSGVRSPAGRPVSAAWPRGPPSLG